MEHANYRFRCNLCGARFKSVRNFQQHRRRAHPPGPRRPCPRCFRVLASRADLERHLREFHGGEGGGEFRLVRSALSNAIQQHSVDFHPRQMPSVEAAEAFYLPRIVRLIERELCVHPVLRQSLIVSARFMKPHQDGDGNVVFRREIFPARVKSRLVLQADRDNLRRIVGGQFRDVLARIELIANEQSGWVFQDVSGIDLELSHAVVLRGAGLDPGSVERAEAVLRRVPRSRRLVLLACDRPGEEHKCFYYAVAFGLLCEEGAEDPSVPLLTNFVAATLVGVKNEPMPLEGIANFERRNAVHAFKINVLVWRREGPPFVGYRSKRKAAGCRKILTLLLLPPSPALPHGHFLFVRPPVSAFLNANGRPRRRCENCFATLSGEAAALQHRELCYKNKTQTVVYPRPGEELRFRALHRLHKIPFVGFLDFESALSPDRRALGAGTTLLTEHRPISYSFLVVDLAQNPVYEQFRCAADDDEDIMEACMRDVTQFYAAMKDVLRRPRPLVMTEEDVRRHEAQTLCYVCLDYFPPGRLVRDHCHYTGKYRGAACNACNLLMYQVHDLPVFVHNLVNYDGIFLTQALKYVRVPSQISAIPKNTEKLKTITVGGIKFLDSLEFLRGSLKQIVDMARQDHLPMFDLLYELGLCRGEEQRELLLKKGVFPYDFCSSVAAIREKGELPSREEFFNELTEEDVGDEDYAHATEVYRTFGCRGMLDYLRLYNRLDTALLCIAFQSYRQQMYEDFGLDPAHYVSTPMLAMDCFLRSCDVRVPLIADPVVTLLAMNNIRGGLSQVNLRHVLVPEDDEMQHLLYIDANNLYGHSMNSSLPVGEYALLGAEEAAALDWRAMSPDDDYGYLVEVDLLYPEALHAAHRHLPLVFDNRVIDASMLSPYSAHCLRLFGAGDRKYEQTKLCADFLPKVKIAVHYLNLKFYLEEGLVLAKVHCAVRFRQRPFVRPYIQLVAQKRRDARNEFSRLNLKLLANSLYGKFLQNDRHHKRIRFVADRDTARKLMGQNEYAAHKIISEDLVAIFLEKKKVKLDKCYLVGFSILELSKLHMLRSFYREIVPRLAPAGVELVLTDTDSFVLRVTGVLRDEMLRALAPIMDFSNYPKTHPFYSAENKGKLGYFKDENAGDFMREVVALRSKCYVTRTETAQGRHREDARCKGVDRRAQQSLTLEQYRRCLRDQRKIFARVRNIQLKAGRLYTVELNKSALTPFDDKRYVRNCGVHTVPYGSVEVDEACAICEVRDEEE